MELQKIVVLCLGVLVLGGGLWYFSQTSDDATPAVSEQPEQQLDPAAETAPAENLSGVGSFASLLGLGQNITCTYSYSDAEGSSGSGTGYFTADRMRVDSVMTADGQTFDSHMINDGEHIFTWTTDAEETFAMKMAVPEESETAVDYEAPTAPDGSERGMVDANQEVEYDCDRWSVDPLVFMPPADIEFMDMAAMMQDAMQNMPEGFEMPEGFPGMQ